MHAMVIKIGSHPKLQQQKWPYRWQLKQPQQAALAVVMQSKHSARHLALMQPCLLDQQQRLL
jgi:hypothetical protein